MRPSLSGMISIPASISSLGHFEIIAPDGDMQGIHAGDRVDLVQKCLTAALIVQICPDYPIFAQPDRLEKFRQRRIFSAIGLRRAVGEFTQTSPILSSVVCCNW